MKTEEDYLELEYLVTALVPSEMACLASSPGSSNRTAVWISREVIMVVFLLDSLASREASPAILSKMSLTNEFMMLMDLEETPVSGWTCFKTL